MTNELPTTHCQICGRNIKSKNGFIAHHGYTRPGEGWQTASCMGAKFAPYEVSAERIKDAISAVEAHIQTVSAGLKSYISNPPASITQTEQTFWERQHKFALKVYEKPVDFSPSLAKGQSYLAYNGEFLSAVRKMERDIEGSKGTLAFLQNRLAKWVKVL